MPAQTHSRVRNGFHILANSRGRLINLNKSPCDKNSACEKAYGCGPALQPTNMRPGKCKRGLCAFLPTKGRDRALALGGVGSRSSTVKRAITRRVQNRNQMPTGYTPSATKPKNQTSWPSKNSTCSINPCACCTITMTKPHPRNACLGGCQNPNSNKTKRCS